MDSGWSQIHYAVYNSQPALVERLVEESGLEILDTTTDDAVQNTPLLLAVSSGSLPLVSLLVGFGADVTYVNRRQEGVVDICVHDGHLHILRYFIDLHHQTINVYKELLKHLDSDAAEDILASCTMIAELTSQSGGHREALVEEGLVSRLVGVFEKNVGDTVKATTLQLLKYILKGTCQESMTMTSDEGSSPPDPGEGSTVGEKMLLDKDGIQVLISFIRNRPKMLLPDIIECLFQLITSKDFAEEFSGLIIPALGEVMADSFQETQEQVLQPSLKVLGLLAAVSPLCKDIIGQQSGFLTLLVRLFQVCRSKPLTIAWSEAVGHIADEHQRNQDILTDENIGWCLQQMLKSKDRDVQMSAVETTFRQVSGNSRAGKQMAESGSFSPLLRLLRKSKSQRSQESIARVVWALAGEDPESQRTVAARIGVSLLVDFLSASSFTLNLIGTGALIALVRGPYDVRNSVMSANAAHHVVRLLRSEREDVVLSAIQTLRHICLGVGFISHAPMQSAVADARGLNFLLALMRHTLSERVQVEAALAIAACVLGHAGNLELIGRSLGFIYSHILRLLRSPSDEVHLMAGEAIAAFAFNGASQQKAIAHCGGVTWDDFSHFLESANHSERICAAFQLVVLAPIIPDKAPSYTCAAGIQTLIGLLGAERNEPALAMAADCVARLSHCRPGLAAAMVSIDVVPALCRLLSSTSEQVKGSSAIALNFLSLNPVAERQLLKRCQYDLDLIRVLIVYNKKRKWPESFLERWRHIRELALPPIRYF
ncbi:uncharacterized protein PAF06_015492 [Gastrophryne carolinensis]